MVGGTTSIGQPDEAKGLVVAHHAATIQREDMPSKMGEQSCVATFPHDVRVIWAASTSFSVSSKVTGLALGHAEFMWTP